MSVEKIAPEQVKGSYVRHRVTECGDYLESVELTRYNSHCGCKKLNRDEYVVVSTGEILPYKHAAETRKDNIKSLRRTMQNIKRIVNANCTSANARNIHWMTFTYADRSVTGADGAERVYLDWKKFWQRFCRYIVKRGISQPEYIAVIEPQRTGVWHLHALLIYPHKRPFIANDIMAQLWGQGFTKTKKVPDMAPDKGGLGAYLGAYLSNAEVDEDPTRGGIVEREVDGQKKRFAKGARLHFYPNGIRIYRCSDGIRHPETVDVSQYEFDRIDQENRLLNELVLKVDDGEGFQMYVRRRYYRKAGPPPAIQNAA